MTDRKKASAAYDGVTDEWLRVHHVVEDVNPITIAAKFYDKSSAERRLHIVWGLVKQAKHLGNPRVSASGKLAPYRQKLNLIIIVICNYCFSCECS